MAGTGLRETPEVTTFGRQSPLGYLTPENATVGGGAVLASCADGKNGKAVLTGRLEWPCGSAVWAERLEGPCRRALQRKGCCHVYVFKLTKMCLSYSCVIRFTDAYFVSIVQH